MNLGLDFHGKTDHRPTLADNYGVQLSTGSDDEAEECETTNKDEDVTKNEDGEEDGEEDGLSLYSTSRASTTSQHTSLSNSMHNIQRPKSRSMERRIASGQLVLMDAKFNHFTARPCTASAILIPLRTGNTMYSR